MSDPKFRDQYSLFVDTHPEMILDGETPRLIDEWQQTPKLWDQIRFEVDHRKGMGHFILTGSAIPAKRDEIFHTGTGRFAWLTMRPMSLWESGDSNGKVSLRELFTAPESIAATCDTDLRKIAFLTCRGGWPQAALMSDDEEIALDQAIDYYDAVVNSDIQRVDDVNSCLLYTSEMLQEKENSIGKLQSDCCLFYKLFGHITCLAIQKLVRES